MRDLFIVTLREIMCAHGVPFRTHLLIRMLVCPGVHLCAVPDGRAPEHREGAGPGALAAHAGHADACRHGRTAQVMCLYAAHRIFRCPSHLVKRPIELLRRMRLPGSPSVLWLWDLMVLLCYVSKTPQHNKRQLLHVLPIVTLPLSSCHSRSERRLEPR